MLFNVKKLYKKFEINNIPYRPIFATFQSKIIITILLIKISDKVKKDIAIMSTLNLLQLNNSKKIAGFLESLINIILLLAN